MRPIIWFSAAALLLVCSISRAASFVVDDIEVVGIKKITIGTVFNYLPINVGESLDIERSPEIIRELYSTGFFENIQLSRRGKVLIITVTERPSIAEVNFEGNNDINDEMLENALDRVGMSKGRIFNKHNLERLELELQQVYFSFGKYAARIKTEHRLLDKDRVAIDISISEGNSAKIKSINLTGNQNFEQSDLLDTFQLESTSDGWFASDDYSSSKLGADLESLKSYYLDRGYINFKVDSQQVTISPDRQDINISVNVNEGSKYTYSAITLAGNLGGVSKSDLRALISLKKGDVVSRKQIARVSTRMEKRFGEDGFAYAKIQILSDVNDKNKTVALSLVAQPGQKMRVRNIVFSGNAQTEDTVLRREMRQLEGELFRQSKVDRSRIRLQRLNYIGSVSFKLERVAGSNSELDIHIAITERFSGSVQIGLGYSEAQGALLNLGLSHDNIFGSGNSIDITFNNSKASEKYRFNYTDPYYTADGVSRGFNFSLAKTDAGENNTSNFLIDQANLSINYGIPLTEYNTLRLEAGITQYDMETTSGSSNEVYEFIIANSDEFTPATAHGDIDGAKFNSLFGSVSFSTDTRNRRIFATSGQLNSVWFNLHGGDLDFYTAGYRNRFAYALSDKYTFAFKTRISYGDGYADTKDLPIFEKFTAGGVRSVRGYDYNSLGPVDSEGDTSGGNLQFITTAEILFPLESLGSSDTFRVGVYFDAGSVFADLDSYESDELRQSIGLSAKWFSVVGPIEFSYAVPLNDEPGDSTKNFQFSLGAAF